MLTPATFTSVYYVSTVHIIFLRRDSTKHLLSTFSSAFDDTYLQNIRAHIFINTNMAVSGAVTKIFRQTLQSVPKQKVAHQSTAAVAANQKYQGDLEAIKQVKQHKFWI